MPESKNTGRMWGREKRANKHRYPLQERNDTEGSQIPHRHCPELATSEYNAGNICLLIPTYTGQRVILFSNNSPHTHTYVCMYVLCVCMCVHMVTWTREQRWASSPQGRQTPRWKFVLRTLSHLPQCTWVKPCPWNWLE